MAGILVRDHHEGHPVTGRHMAEELFHGLQPTGGGADPDDQKTGRSWRDGRGERCSEEGRLVRSTFGLSARDLRVFLGRGRLFETLLSGIHRIYLFSYGSREECYVYPRVLIERMQWGRKASRRQEAEGVCRRGEGRSTVRLRLRENLAVVSEIQAGTNGRTET